MRSRSQASTFSTKTLPPTLCALLDSVTNMSYVQGKGIRIAASPFTVTMAQNTRLRCSYPPAETADEKKNCTNFSAFSIREFSENYCIIVVLTGYFSVLVRRKESRKRILCFHLPAAIPLSPSLRLLENDSSVVGLQDIYDQHLRELNISKEDPVLMHAEKFRAILDSTKPSGTLVSCPLVDSI